MKYLFALAALCAGISAGPAVAKEPLLPPAKVVTEDSRSIVTTRIGVPLEIQLRAQPGTGFSWVSAGAVPGLRELKPLKAAKPMPGSAQVQRFQFLPQGTGTFRLSFSYDQPWRGGTKGAKTKGFIVVVKPN